MKLMIFKKTVIFLAIFAILYGCTYSETSNKTPIFTTDLNTLSDNLNSIVQYESADIQGSEIKTDDEITSELTFKIINGFDIPEEADQRDKLAQSIALFLKKSLKNPEDFDKYNISFISQTVTQNLMGDFTTNKNITKTFNKEDLQ
jgi:hypothetical protein